MSTSTPFPFASGPSPKGLLTTSLKALVLPTDFSPEAEGVLPVALVIAERTGAVIHLVHVLAPAAGSLVLWREQQAQSRLDSIRMQYRHSLLGRAQMQTAVLAPGDTPGALADYVKQHGAGLVLEAIDRAATRDASVPYAVLFVPPGNPSALRRLVAIGASETLRSLLGQVLLLPVIQPEGDGAHDFRADALLVAPPVTVAPSA